MRPCGEAEESRTHIGVCEEMRKKDKCDTEKFSALLIDNREKTIAILGDRWWPQRAKNEEDAKYLKNEVSAQTLEMSLLGVGTVLRLERDAWSMVK